VLGDGRQEKSYLHVGDCVAAILAAAERHGQQPGARIYNLGTQETIVVDESVKVIAGHLSLSPRIEHTGGRRGWTGDSPLILLDTTRIRSLGWEPKLTIEQGIVRTLDWLSEHDYVWREHVDASAEPAR
jgi:UDP-glucose 4-epimerase